MHTCYLKEKGDQYTYIQTNYIILDGFHVHINGKDLLKVVIYRTNSQNLHMSFPPFIYLFYYFIYLFISLQGTYLYNVTAWGIDNANKIFATNGFSLLAKMAIMPILGICVFGSYDYPGSSGEWYRTIMVLLFVLPTILQTVFVGVYSFHVCLSFCPSAHKLMVLAGVIDHRQNTGWVWTERLCVSRGRTCCPWDLHCLECTLSKFLDIDGLKLFWLAYGIWIPLKAAEVIKMALGVTYMTYRFPCRYNYFVSFCGKDYFCINVWVIT